MSHMSLAVAATLSFRMRERCHRKRVWSLDKPQCSVAVQHRHLMMVMGVMSAFCVPAAACGRGGS